MSQIEVPSWVVEIAAKAYFEDMSSLDRWNDPMDEKEREDWRDGARKIITAALGDWVVPAGFMDAKAEFMLPRPGRCVLSSQTVLVRDAYEGRNLPLYTLRQEKPE